MTDFRVLHSSWYQVPVLYSWWDHTAGGGSSPRRLPLERARQRRRQRRSSAIEGESA